MSCCHELPNPDPIGRGSKRAFHMEIVVPYRATRLKAVVEK